MEFIDIAPECFADKDLTVISYKGENFYRACNALVKRHADGSSLHCVKRVGHPSVTHESYDGHVTSEDY